MITISSASSPILSRQVYIRGALPKQFGSSFWKNLANLKENLKKVEVCKLKEAVEL